MISDELKNIVEQLKDKGKTNLLDGVTEEQIADFEKTHEIAFPLKYREWLQYSDGGELFLPAGIQLYGVAHKPYIDANDDDRPDDKYTIIGSLASGDPILCEKSEEKISIYDRETSSIDEELIYDDFFAFLNDLCDLLGIGE